MRRKKQKTSKIFFTILIIAALCVGGFFVYEYFIKEKEPANTKIQSSSESVIEQDTKKDPDTQPDNNKEVQKPKTEDGKESIVKYEGENPNQSEQITGTITYAEKTDTDLVIRISLDQYLNNGTCKLNLIKNDLIKYTDTVNLITEVSTSTCKGFNVPLNKLEKGKYIININLNSNSKAGTVNGEIII